MNGQADFIIKLIVFSLGFSLLIKYVTPFINVPATEINAIMIVMVLPLTMTLLLFWRLKNNSNSL